MARFLPSAARRQNLPLKWQSFLDAAAQAHWVRVARSQRLPLVVRPTLIFTGTTAIARTESCPRTQVSSRGKRAHIRSDFGQDANRRVLLNSGQTFQQLQGRLHAGRLDVAQDLFVQLKDFLF